MLIYNPNTLKINTFICGDQTSSNFDTILSSFNPITKVSEQILTGMCMNLKYC